MHWQRNALTDYIWLREYHNEWPDLKIWMYIETRRVVCACVWDRYRRNIYEILRRVKSAHMHIIRWYSQDIQTCWASMELYGCMAQRKHSCSGLCTWHTCTLRAFHWESVPKRLNRRIVSAFIRIRSDTHRINFFFPIFVRFSSDPCIDTLP